MNCLRLCLLVLTLTAGLKLWQAAERLRAEVAGLRRAQDAAAEGRQQLLRALQRAGRN